MRQRLGHHILIGQILVAVGLGHAESPFRSRSPLHRPDRFLRALRSIAAIGGTCVLLAGCGGSKSADVTFPELGAEQDGYPAASVADQAEADSLCEAAQDEWPVEWTDAEGAVTLDVPDTGGDDPDLICTRP